MTTKTAKTKKGDTVYTIVIDEEFNESISAGNMGFCIACGADAWGVEPDARRYECESCGRAKVFGLEELVLMGYAR